MLHEGAIFTFIILGKMKTFYTHTLCVHKSTSEREKSSENTNFHGVDPAMKERRKSKTFHRIFIFIGSRRKAVMVIWICEIEKEVFRGKTLKIGEGGIIGEKLFKASQRFVKEEAER